MRKAILIGAALVAAWVAWLAWPLPALYRLAHAVETRDAAALSEEVDFAAVRRSLVQQIMAAYVRVTGAKSAPSGLVATIAGTIADSMVAKIVSPEGLVELLGTGRPGELVSRQSDDAQGLSSEALSDRWQLFLNSKRGFDRFSFSFPGTKSMAQRIQLEWRLHKWRWKLASVTLPEDLVTQLAQELAKAPRGR
jgi:Protein of unknown function (DUF2939)